MVRDIVSLPAQVETLEGTIWDGRAGLSGGQTLRWTASPGWLLDAEVTLEGAETQLSGTLSLRPRSVAVADLRGRAGSDLLALVPGSPVTVCTTRAVVAVDEAAFGGGAAVARGRVDIAAGRCTDASGRSNEVPAMTLDLSTEGNDALAVLSAQDAPADVLARARVTGDRRLILTVEPAGARFVPGMSSSAPTMLEYPF